MKKILLGYKFQPGSLDELEDKYEIIEPMRSSIRREEIIEKIGDVDIFIPNLSIYTDKEIMDKATKLKLISNYAVGFNNIDVDYATEKGIVITNTPQTVLEPTAEFTFALLMAVGRKLGFYDRKLRTEEGLSWNMYKDPNITLYGKTLGIIGMGRIGQAVARRAMASGMNILYNNRNRVNEETEKIYNAKYSDLQTLLRESDYISLNAPYTKETYHLIGEKEFAMMKPSAVFVNTARGSLVDEQAMAKALKENIIFGAGIDVFENEPHILPELLELDNIILTPHAATKSTEVRLEMAHEMVRNIIGFYDGKYPISRVN